MLDENIWVKLSDEEKIIELKNYLDQINLIEEGKHKLTHTPEQGKLAGFKKELCEKIFKIIELENPL
jgi:hypothetical protein